MAEGASSTNRLEALSDGAFAVAIGLLVVEVIPVDEFKTVVNIVRHAPAIAAAFAVFLWIWSVHRHYFATYALHDPKTVVLNSVLLFLVLFYVYPLKFVSTYVIEAIFHLNPETKATLASPEDGALLLQIYGVGFVAIFLCYALLYRHALSRRAVLGLDDVQVLEARMSARACGLCMIVGLVSLAVTFVPGGPAKAVAGFSYSLIGPVMGVHGYLAGKARERLEAAR